MLAPLILLLAVQAQDPVEVRSRLQDREIRAGETVVLRVDVETDGERASIERFSALPPGIELVGTRDYDQRQFSLPGGTRRFISREFVLRGRAAGQYRIPQVRVTVGARQYTAPSTLLTVLPAPGAGGAEISGASDRGVVLRAWLDSDTVFVGEQVTLEVEAMFSQDARLRLRRAPEYQPPTPSGFWVHDLPDPRSTVSRPMAGDVYEVQTFRRAFFPLADGGYTIPPATLEYEMRRGLLYAPEMRRLESDPMPLVVLPVPAEGQPPGFTGAVGEFDVRGWLEPARVPAGEAAVLTVEVEGTGNIKALPPPALPDLPDMEVFPPTEEATTETEGITVRGRKRFSWVVIPRAAGKQEIPPIRYAYFQPEAGRYETAEVASLTLDVEPSATADRPVPAAASLRYLKTAPAAGGSLSFVRSSWFLAAQLVPLALLGLALLALQVRGRSGTVSAGELRRRRKRGIRDLERRARDGDSAVLAEADRWARGWLVQRLQLTGGEAADPASLQAIGVSGDTATSLAGALQRLAAARYAPQPPGPEARTGLIRALGRALERVDREAPPVGRGRARHEGSRAAGRGAGMSIALVLALGPAGHAVAQSPPTDVFRQGLELFDAGRYGPAAAAFDRYLERRPDDPAAWYNLGTAYHRAGHDGYAAWAWLHVPALAPRDSDTRHNLRVAGVAPELVARVAPAVPLRTEEALLLAAVAWLLAGLAGAWWVLRRRTGAGVVAAVALLLAMAAAASAWDSTRGGRTLIVLETATLRAGPNLRAEPLATLRPGSGLVPLARQDRWVRARTLAGEEGWIEIQETGSL